MSKKIRERMEILDLCLGIINGNIDKLRRENRHLRNPMSIISGPNSLAPKIRIYRNNVTIRALGKVRAKLRKFLRDGD